MRYLVKGNEIRSENAAKPPSAAGKWLLGWIRQLPSNAEGLDLGCGKLRYTIPLSRRIASVTAVDSEIQLTRQQKIGSRVCSIGEYVARHLPNVKVYPSDDLKWQKRRYDVILCSNVLSAIPLRGTRMGLLKSAYKCLRRDGVFLVTSQFRNSHFSAWKSHPNAEIYLDGYLVHSSKRTSFYGLLDARSLRRLCVIAGFDIIESGHTKETAYVLARRSVQRKGVVSRSIRIKLF
jgi:SAM-dependent methyltransferase